MQHDQASFDPSVLWDERTVARYLGVKAEYLQQDRHDKRRIPFVKVGRLVRYEPADVYAFKDASKVRGSVTA